MLKHIIQHKRQEKDTTCGAACFGMIVDCDESQAVKECKTKFRGTNIHNVKTALLKRGIETEIVELNVDYSDYFHWLKLNSKNRKLYLNCLFLNSHGGRGRFARSRHSIVASNGFIYDPAENEPIPIEAYFHKASKGLKLKYMLMIDA